jgi:antitoxin VapB
MPEEAKLFRNNRSQAVRIPVEFELPAERKKAPSLAPEDRFPAIEDRPARSADIF